MLKDGKNPFTGKTVTDYIGNALVVITGYGWNSVEWPASSAIYRGLNTSLTGVIMSLVSRNPKVPTEGRIYIK